MYTEVAATCKEWATPSTYNWLSDALNGTRHHLASHSDRAVLQDKAGGLRVARWVVWRYLCGGLVRILAEHETTSTFRATMN